MTEACQARQWTESPTPGTMTAARRDFERLLRVKRARPASIAWSGTSRHPALWSTGTVTCDDSLSR